MCGRYHRSCIRASCVFGVWLALNHRRSSSTEQLVWQRTPTLGRQKPYHAHTCLASPTELDSHGPGLCGLVEVTLVDANHCPGAVQLLFRLPGGQRYVHCGDFRFHARMLADARLAAFQRAAALYLDTTYCQPNFCFPLQACLRP